MGTTDNNTWGRIQQGVKDTERLMSQRQYNLSMVKARQTLELMVNCLGEKALIVEGDLADSIDQLYEGRWISQATRDRYHRIRVIGNKAVHDGNDSAYDANEAYQTLVQEANAFANIYNNKRGSAAPRQQQQQPQQRQAVRTTSQTSRPTASRPAASRSGSQRPPQRSGSRSPQRPSSSNKSRRRAKQRGFDPYDLLKPAIILVAILLVVFIIVKLVPGKDDKKETTMAEATTPVTTEAPLVPTEAPTTAPETEAPKIYTTTAKLNVRSEPSTSSTVLGKLASGTEVEYVKTLDSSWIVIKFEGIEAYVSSDYISITEETQEDESSSEEESPAESTSTAA